MIAFYGEDFNVYYYTKIIKTKRSKYGYSILYSKYLDEYFYVSQEEPFIPLFDDKGELEKIRNNFNIEDYLDNKENSKIEEEESQNEEE